MYRWIVLLHVLGVLVFVLLHGASAVVFLKLRQESEPDRIKALLELSVYPANASWVSLGVALLSGIALGFMGSWWAWGWIWASIGVLIVMIGAMSMLGSRALNFVRGDLGLQSSYGEPPPDPAVPVDPDALKVRMAQLRVWPLMAVGVGGLAILTWLMLFKPF